MGEPSSKRLFFAISPGDAVRRHLRALAERYLRGAGRLTPARNLHMTLCFLGQVASSRITEIIAIGDEVHSEIAGMRLQQLGMWPTPQVAWSAPLETPPALLGLVRQLREGWAARGGRPETRTFRPHVTLARKVSQPIAVEHEIVEWPVESFALMV